MDLISLRAYSKYVVNFGLQPFKAIVLNRYVRKTLFLMNVTAFIDGHSITLQ